MLEIAGLDAFYNGAHILHGIGLGLEEGTRVALVGRNGAGKSTFLKSVMNVGPRATGEIRLDGVALARLPVHLRVRRGLGFVPEDRRILMHLTVLENIVMAARAAPGRAEDPQVALNRFEMLVPLRDRKGGQLSGGQQQMLAIARALVARPRFLLLDEPTEGLAPVIVQSLAKEVVRSCEESGAALLLCEQNLWFARRCTNFIHVIDSGRIVFSGDWAAFDADDGIKQKYLSV